MSPENSYFLGMKTAIFNYELGLIVVPIFYRNIPHRLEALEVTIRRNKNKIVLDSNCSNP